MLGNEGLYVHTKGILGGEVGLRASSMLIEVTVDYLIMNLS